MRARRAVALSSALGVGAALAACFDVFHSTADIVTACDLSPASPACAIDAGAGAASADDVDVCASDPADARREADRVCAWLGACETPMGRNAFGPCSFQARMAYDCASNPNHRVKGAARALWACMLDATTCADVDRCVFPAGRPACAAGGRTSCGGAGAAASNEDVRVSCADGGAAARGENCAMWGQTCADDGAGGACVGPTGAACARSECVGSALRWCDGDAGGGANVGVDCAASGAQRCGVFPSGDASLWAACVAESDAGARAACAPSAAAACDGGVAASCPSGVAEVIDCATLLGVAGACSAGPLSPPFDWTSACAASPPRCTADACDDAGATLTGCARGAALRVSCEDQGLGPCREVAVAGDAGPELRAACAPP